MLQYGTIYIILFRLVVLRRIRRGMSFLPGVEISASSLRTSTSIAHFTLPLQHLRAATERCTVYKSFPSNLSFYFLCYLLFAKSCCLVIILAMGKPKSKPNAALPTHLSSNKHGVPSVSASSPAVIALRGNGKSTGKSPRPQLQTQTQTDTMVVTEFQSLQLVRTVITATISNIIWTRKIFPRNLFVCRMYNLNDPEVSYDHFMSGKGRFGSQAGDDGIVWRVFQPNVHAGMDKVLKWLVSNPQLDHPQPPESSQHDRMLALPMLWRRSSWLPFNFQYTNPRSQWTH